MEPFTWRYKPVSVNVKAGQFLLFGERTIHMSGPNRTDRNRTGLAVRVIPPVVRIGHDRVFAGHEAMLLNGEDRLGFNRIMSPPA